MPINAELEKLQALEKDVEQGSRKLTAGQRLKWQIDDIIAGRRKSVRIKHHYAIQMSQALLPGTVTIICGSPGVSKSLWLQEVLMDLHFHQTAISLLHLEENLIYHLRRAVAQLAGVSNYTDEEWVRLNPQEATSITEIYQGQVDSFAECITDCQEKRLTYADILTWVKNKAEEGKRVLAVDPISLARRAGKNPWEADEEFVCAAGRIIDAAGISLVLVSHPVKSQAKMGMSFMDSLAGGAGLTRYCQSLFWLETREPVIGAKISNHGHIFESDEIRPINRVLHLVKTRNGCGNGKQLAYHFDPQTLRHEEIGILIIDKRKRGKSC